MHFVFRSILGRIDTIFNNLFALIYAQMQKPSKTNLKYIQKITLNIDPLQIITKK